MLTKFEIKKIKKYSLHLDWDIAFDGRSKGNRHLFRIRDIAIELSKKEGGRRDIIEAAAWLHNVGLIKGDKNHDLNGKRIAGAFLSKLGIPPADREQILHCIESHEGSIRATTTEAKIVHDADVIDKMGPLGVIRQTWKLANSGFPTEKICQMLPPYFSKRRKNLYTKSAKSAAKHLDDELKPFFKTAKIQL